MLCYGTLQEAATFLAYSAQKNRAAAENDKTLEAIFHLVARDEAAHAGFYREALTLELAEDREGALADLSHVIANFRMPGDGLIPNYLENLKVGGGGISARHFFQHGVLPTLKQLGTSRSELRALPNPIPAMRNAAEP
jgi:acyl-[acyl-carrier-protein] desaturase